MVSKVQCHFKYELGESFHNDVFTLTLAGKILNKLETNRDNSEIIFNFLLTKRFNFVLKDQLSFRSISLKIKDLQNSSHPKHIKILQSYKQHVKHYKKRHFDIFNKENHICIKWKNQNINTSLSQLNFLDWFIDNASDLIFEIAQKSK